MERVFKIINSPSYREILKELEELEKDRIFCKHDFEHFLGTARISYIMHLENKNQKDKNLKELSKEVIYAAGLLHDIGRPEEYKTGADHALVGGEKAVQFLKEAQFTDTEIEIIKAAVEEHRRLPKEPTYLGEILYKADKLSRPCYNCKAIDKCYKKELVKDIYLQY